MKIKNYKIIIIIFLIIILIISLLYNYNNLKIFKKYEKFSETEGSVITISGIDFDNRFILSKEDLEKEIIRLNEKIRDSKEENTENIQNYVNDLIIIFNKLNDNLIAIETLQDQLNEAFNRLLKYNNRYEVINDKIGSVIPDLINSTCRTNITGNKFNKCNNVCQKTCAENNLCYGYNYYKNSDEEFCELVVNERNRPKDGTKGVNNFTINTNTKFYKKIGAEPTNWNYYIFNKRKTDQTPFFVMDGIKNYTNDVLKCSDKCNEFNNIDENYCLSFVYDKKNEKCNFYNNVYKNNKTNTSTDNIIVDNTESNNLYTKKFHDPTSSNLDENKDGLNVVVNHGPKTPNKVIKDGFIKLKFKGQNTYLGFHIIATEDRIRNGYPLTKMGNSKFANISLNINKNNNNKNNKSLTTSNKIKNINLDNYLHKDNTFKLQSIRGIPYIKRIPRSFRFKSKIKINPPTRWGIGRSHKKTGYRGRCTKIT